MRVPMGVFLEKVLKTGISIFILSALFVFRANSQFVQVNVESRFGSTSANGFGAFSMLNRPAGITNDSRGFVYIADRDNHCIRKYTNSGGLETIAGIGGFPGYRDGASATALFYQPMDVAASVTGDTIFVVDFGNSRIRMIDLRTNVVRTLAGGATNAVNVDDAIGTLSRFSLPYCIEVWGRDLIVVERNVNPFGRVRRVSMDGTNRVQTLSAGGFTTNPVVPFSLVEVNDITLGPNNQFFAVGNTAHSIFSFNPFTGVGSVIAGSGVAGSNDGIGTAATFRFPWGIEWDGNQTLYITDQNHRVRTMNLTTQLVSTLAGSISGFLDGQGVNAFFSSPAGICVAPGNQIFVADQFNNRLRQVDPQGNVTSRAGGGNLVDGIGLNMRFNDPRGLAIWRDSVLFVADRGNHIIRKVNLVTGRSNIFAGIGTVGNLDGNWNASTFQSPSACLVHNDTLYVTDGNSRVRKIALTGTGLMRGAVTTLTSGMQLGNGNVGMVVYRDTLFLTEAQKNRVIKMALYGNEMGRVKTFLGGGALGQQAGYAEGNGVSALFTNPNALALFRDTLFIGDDQRLVRKVALSGPDYGNTQYFAGKNSTGIPSGGADTSVNVSGLTCLMADKANKIMFAGCGNGRVIGFDISGANKGKAYVVINNQNSTILGAADGQGNTPANGNPLGAKMTSAGSIVFQDSLKYWMLDEDAGRIRFLEGVIPNSPPSFTMTNLVRRRQDTSVRVVRHLARNLSEGANPGESNQRMFFRVSFTNGTIFKTPPRMVLDTLPGGEQTANLVFQTNQFANGTSILRMRLYDNGGTNNGGVDSSEQIICTLIVVPVNQRPTFRIAGNNPIITTVGLFTNVFNGYLSNVSPGHFSEGSQVITAEVTNSDPSKFTAQPSIAILGTGNNRSGDLTFIPTTADTGRVTLFIKLKDNGGTDSGGIDSSVAQQVLLILKPQINSAPTFMGATNQVAINASTRRTVPGWIINISPGTYSYEASQTLTYTIRNSNPLAFTPTGQPEVTPQTIGPLLGGQLTYTPSGNVSGVINCRLIIKDDGGITNGGVDSAATDFTITLNPNGINQNLALEKISIYPNPFIDDISLLGLIEGAYKVFWLNIQGKILASQNLEVSNSKWATTITTPDLTSGFYIIKVENERYSQMLRVVKK